MENLFGNKLAFYLLKGNQNLLAVSKMFSLLEVMLALIF
jgi:hypothetical protein